MLFFSVLLLLTSLCSYSLRSIIWNEILGVRASFRVVTVGHYRVFRWMNGAFVHWLLFSTFWDKKKNLFLKTENVNRIFYYTKLVLNIVTFWEILFLRCLSEKCQGFGNELWFFWLEGASWQVTIFLLCVRRRRPTRIEVTSQSFETVTHQKAIFWVLTLKNQALQNFPSLKKNFH